MSLTGADVAEILRLLESSSFDELDLELNGMKMVLRGGSGARAESPAMQATPPATGVPAPGRPG